MTAPMGHHAKVTKISKLSMHKVSYHIKLEADRPDGGRWVQLITKKLGADYRLFPSEFPNDEVKKVVLHVTSSGKPSAQVGNLISVEWT
jgi:hypothetical protein